MKKMIWSVVFLMLFFIAACSETNNGSLADNQYEIMSDAMSPVIQVGAIVTIEELNDGSTLQIGDYIMVELDVINPSTSEQMTVEAAKMIVEIEMKTIAGNEYYSFVVNSINQSESTLITFDQILGKIINIDNP